MYVSMAKQNMSRESNFFMKRTGPAKPSRLEHDGEAKNETGCERQFQVGAFFSFSFLTLSMASVEAPASSRDLAKAPSSPAFLAQSRRGP